MFLPKRKLALGGLYACLRREMHFTKDLLPRKHINSSPQQTRPFGGISVIAESLAKYFPSPMARWRDILPFRKSFRLSPSRRRRFQRVLAAPSAFPEHSPLSAARQDLRISQNSPPSSLGLEALILEAQGVTRGSFVRRISCALTP